MGDAVPIGEPTRARELGFETYRVEAIVLRARVRPPRASGASARACPGSADGHGGACVYMRDCHGPLAIPQDRARCELDPSCT